MSAPHTTDLPALPHSLPTTDAEARALIAALDASLDHRRATVGGRDVVFRRTGTGPPLLLVHGGHGCWLHWVKNIAALARHRTVWLVDMPGYGDSGTLADPPTLEHLAGALADAVAQVAGAQTPLDIAGFSFGGLVAAHMAALRQQRTAGSVRRVALLGTSGHGSMRRERLRMLDWKSVADDPAERDLRLAHNLTALMLHDPAALDPLALALHRQACLQTRFVSKAYASRAVIGPALDTLAAHGVPVLLAWGLHDVTATPADTAPAVAAGRSACTWRLLPDAGHWMQYERPEATDALLLEWLQADSAEI